MTRGRKATVSAARDGTARHRKTTDLVPANHSGALPVEVAAEIPFPRSIRRTQANKAIWKTLLCEAARHELRLADIQTNLEPLFVAIVRRREASEYIRKQGLMIVTPAIKDPYSGDTLVAERCTKNPMLKEERDQSVLIDRLAQRVGFSLESRIRLDLMKAATGSFVALLARELEKAVSGTGDAEVIDGEVIEE